MRGTVQHGGNGGSRRDWRSAAGAPSCRSGSRRAVGSEEDRAERLLRVAERFGFAGKGRIEPGYDADLALLDLTHGTVLQSTDLHYRHKHSPFVGRTLRGRVVRTLLRGEPVYADGAFASEPRGRLLRPGERGP